MNGKHKFPEGTLFSGENAFIPISEAKGGGFKMVKLEDFDNSDLLSDNLGVYDDAEVKNDDDCMSEIKFDVDYKPMSFKKQNDQNGQMSFADFEKSNKKSDATENVAKTAAYESNFSDKDEYFDDFDEDNEKSEKTTEIKNIHHGHRERLKNRYDKLGLEGFEDHEVLEFLLYFTHKRCDTNPIAHALINEFGSLEKVLKADRRFLEGIDGVGKKSSLLISFCHQLMLYLNSKIPEKLCLAKSTDVGRFCCKFFKDRTEETFAVLMLDTKKNLQNVVIISKGTENETAYYPRNVVKEVIKHKANIVIIAHNHTGNSVHPSDNDIIITRAISNLLEGIGVPLLDHIICCGDIFTSLAERNLMQGGGLS